ncbi:hypothetical protein IT774_07505 [Salinimonas marina]|uniref:Deoxynucleotide monophosphate kinase n=1 Tax=Salinimonas marina TaxID=2785918 RepID=A0A7S9E0S8_9ALTE|nr:hypothetical protein [Salinimonas marina]QPG06940.1 hypothetical protein IT774_07505 [Salinimonas marina]
MSKPIVIGISGAKQSGKNYGADVIRRLANKMHLFTCEVAFADPIKQMLIVGLGMQPSQFETEEAKNTVDPRYGVTPRRLMQTLGTDWGRDMINQNLWLIRAQEQIDTTAVDIVLVTDVRFDNEAALVRQNERGHIACIHPTIKHMTRDDHASEAGISTYGFDYLIPNNFDATYEIHLNTVFRDILAKYDRPTAEANHDRVSVQSRDRRPAN